MVRPSDQSDEMWNDNADKPDDASDRNSSANGSSRGDYYETFRTFDIDAKMVGFGLAKQQAISCAGRLAQASKASQSLAGMMTIRRSSMSVSAASTALRRTKSLRLVCACSLAASNIARSSWLTRTLSTVVDMAVDPVG